MSHGRSSCDRWSESSMAAPMGSSLHTFPVLLGWLLLASLSLGLSTGDSLNDDLLLPYPGTRTRLPRDCRPVRNGTRPHESWPPPGRLRPKRGPVVHRFVSYFPDSGNSSSRAVSGHLTVAVSPLHSFSVLEPGGPGGCAAKRLVTVEETARAAGCIVAQNGGFFRMDTGECLGNIVSNGYRVGSSGGLQNAQFGIRQDGTLVTGYLSEEEVLDTKNPFVQLVSGVVWLLRNGEVYIKESEETECDKTQETGSFSKFVNVISARTAVGHDREGRLVLFHADGQTEQRGINLWDMADFLKKQGVVNAINLDGGGSATFVVNGTISNYPSDHCKDNSMWRCPRRISTVVCVHEPRCNPPDCNGHGTCVQGTCHCNGHFWGGDDCSILDCGPSNCSLHGLCTENGCQCHAGWIGSNCSQACANGSFGVSCAQKCQCQNGAACDPVNGTCTCLPGFQGDNCAEVCPLGRYGPNCQYACTCENSCLCDPKSGNCNFTSTVQDILSQVGQCLGTSMVPKNEEHPYFTKTAWLSLTLALALLLLLSAAANVTFILGSRASRRRLDGEYAYHPLQEMNGELNSLEKEQQGDPTFSIKNSEQ
ncbi:N-acetylglucosamine-1-phosphodiester alpha-N-acetylglucosaminidase isoform X1 [Antechinus flavipes]|uniref:N-acetylglucosamine-1-phosphodiester alpha-N-acetylglucosaminidase isoform X1 n=1 Tax=Antechinus flavipes TaxID=38775 RepID=UPI002235F706|nr:N-acetylglucosamine-1-phosphodiester alpha-N-acetylglucosaminidase isoform X1 [Antechinus flavipes]